MKELTSAQCLLPCWCCDRNYTGELEMRARFLYTEIFPKFPRYAPDRTARFRNTLALTFHFVHSFTCCLLVQPSVTSFSRPFEAQVPLISALTKSICKSCIDFTSNLDLKVRNPTCFTSKDQTIKHSRYTGFLSLGKRKIQKKKARLFGG